MLKKLWSSLFGKVKEEDGPGSVFIIAQINEKIMPTDRADIYEDALEEYLKEMNIGEVTGGGTFQEPTGEIAGCDIEIEVSGGKVDDAMLSGIISKLEQLGAPKGSKLTVEGTSVEVAFGRKEGLAVYLDGQNLPKEVYETSDVNEVMEELKRLTGVDEGPDRYWEGAAETALYYYGDSFQVMREAIAGYLQGHPLCQGARVVQIA